MVSQICPACSGPQGAGHPVKDRGTAQEGQEEMVLSRPGGTLFVWLRSGLSVVSRGAMVTVAPISHASMGPGASGELGSLGRHRSHEDSSLQVA